uniref:GHMP kinase N-terminal domain-containing protein n=1 Tax=Picocystis salinarum TaxID=88271 RepID=A0A7S3XCH6_9CHLO|mmetsp:Transcript_7562/g.46516  ORF Transcript_7562/g.46516 Transcript_7562/m.46516 type:complete len:398 (-) Transcript_7562:822-2015(-)
MAATRCTSACKGNVAMLGPRRRRVRVRAADGSDGGSVDPLEALSDGIRNDFQKRQEILYSPQQRWDQLQKELPQEKQRRSMLKVFSPSKINVFLRVMRRREDGFHDLASLFHVIDLGDTLKFSLSPSKTRDAITTRSPDVPLDKSNLIYRALNLFREKTGIEQYFWIDLDKRVPSGAGLGGGSGNASSTLWAANQMCGCPATEAQLMEWSAELGSDCPVFFSHGAAYCTGRGEVVEDIPSPLPQGTEMVLIKPPVGLSTPEIFRALDLDRRSTADPRELLDRLSKEGCKPDITVNDLEQPAFSTLPALRMLKDRLALSGQRKYDSVFMTGSGSTIVCMGSSEAPPFLYDDKGFDGVSIIPARLLTRRPGTWYSASNFVDEEGEEGEEEGLSFERPAS